MSGRVGLHGPDSGTTYDVLQRFVDLMVHTAAKVFISIQPGEVVLPCLVIFAQLSIVFPRGIEVTSG